MNLSLKLKYEVLNIVEKEPTIDIGKLALFLTVANTDFLILRTRTELWLYEVCNVPEHKCHKKFYESKYL